MEVQLQSELRRPEAALRAVQKPPAKPWRGGPSPAAAAQPPPKVYRVEPREFRELVQRLTGAPTTTTTTRRHMPTAPPPQVVQPQQPVPVRTAAAQQQQLYGSWFSFPLVDGGASGGLM